MAKKVRMTNLTKIYTKKGNWSSRASRSPQISQKNCISNRTFSCHVKRLSNKYGENSKNDKFNENLNLEREMVK